MKINKSLSACQSVSDSSSSSSDDWTQIKKVTNLSLLWLNLRVAALSCCSCLFPEPPSVRLACPSVRPSVRWKKPRIGRARRWGGGTRKLIGRHCMCSKSTDPTLSHYGYRMVSLTDVTLHIITARTGLSF